MRYCEGVLQNDFCGIHLQNLEMNTVFYPIKFAQLSQLKRNLCFSMTLFNYFQSLLRLAIFIKSGVLRLVDAAM